jgi:hypothetical protein
LQSSPCDRARPRSNDRPVPDRGGPLFSSPPDLHTGTAVAKFHDERDILIDDPDDGYVIDHFSVRRQAYWLEREFEEKLGFPVAVQPVLTVWARFPEKEGWIGDLAVVHASRIAHWLEARPANLLREDKRRLVAAWVKTLPKATK